MTCGWVKLTVGAGLTTLIMLSGNPHAAHLASPQNSLDSPLEAPPRSDFRLAVTSQAPSDPPPEAPSTLWLIVMPAIPLLGGAMPYWSRRLRQPPPSGGTGLPPAMQLTLSYFPLSG